MRYIAKEGTAAANHFPCELKNMYMHLPDYWKKLREIQALLSDPMKGEGKSIFELERRFSQESKPKS